MRSFPPTGLSFRAWQRQLRLLAALEQLAEGQPVTGVGLDLGYASQSAMMFKAETDVTPARYFLFFWNGQKPLPFSPLAGQGSTP